MAESHADPAPAPAPKGILLKADTIAEPFLAEVKANLAAVLSPSSSSTTGRRPPKLLGILATASAAPSRSYAEFTRKQCTALGIAFELREVGQDDGVEEAIIEANADDSVDGIMVRITRSISTILSKNKKKTPRCTTRFSGRSGYVSRPSYPYTCPIHATGPLLAADRLAFQGRRRAQLQVPLQPLSQVTSLPCSRSHLPFALTCTQHPLPRAKVPASILALSRGGSTADQQRRPAARNRQVDPTVHSSRGRESARARRGIQRAATLRRSRLRPHHNRDQPVNPNRTPLP